MSTERAPARLTYDDLQRLPDDGQRHELVDGMLVVTPAPDLRHQDIVLFLAMRLRAFADARQLGRVNVAPTEVRLGSLDAVQPDVLFVGHGGAARATPRGIEGPPDLVVEVLSPASRTTDAVTKRQLYGHYGVREYWLVDPDTDSIKVFRRSGESLAQVHELTAEAGDVLTTPLVPGFELSLAELFAPLESR